jgi:hypothetical protein
MNASTHITPALTKQCSNRTGQSAILSKPRPALSNSFDLIDEKNFEFIAPRPGLQETSRIFHQFRTTDVFVGSPRTKEGPKSVGRCCMKRLLIAFVLILAGCAPMAEMIQNAGQPTAKTVSATEQSIDQAQLEPYNGPKARVGVYRFIDQTAKGGGTISSILVLQLVYPADW